jgi:hypothetical protein
VIAIYTDIGRGHPNYLDSVLRYLRQHHPESAKRIEKTSVFDISKGLSLQAWKIVRMLYRIGSRGGPVSEAYSKLRSNGSAQSGHSILLSILGKDIITHLSQRNETCVVEHPIVARIIGDRWPVFYVHGEIAAPRESAVQSVSKVYVPLASTAEKMIAAGVRAESVVTTGLMLEPELCPDLNRIVEARLARLRQSERFPLTIGFFISGAYPHRHVELMVAGALSCRRHNCRVRMFWGADTKKAMKLRDRFQQAGVTVTLDDGTGDPRNGDLVIVSVPSREAETIKSTQYIPQLDLFCAAPHERVNWAVGVGLPMIAIVPPIGSFAPENLRFVMESGCGIALSTGTDFANLGELVSMMRKDGRLHRMCIAGRSTCDVNGTQAVAEDILAHAR